jgi:hypothetical protein
LEIYAIANNQITNAAFIGTVGFDWQFSGVGNFSGVPGNQSTVAQRQYRRVGSVVMHLQIVEGKAEDLPGGMWQTGHTAGQCGSG